MKSSHCVPEFWSLRGIAAQRSMTEQVGFHRGEWGPPTPVFNAVQFSSPSLNRAHTFPCKLQVSLIIPNTNFNECLHQPRRSFFWIKAAVLQQDQCDFYDYDHSMAFSWSQALHCWPFCNHGSMMGMQMTLPNRVYTVYLLTTKMIKI